MKNFSSRQPNLQSVFKKPGGVRASFRRSSPLMQTALTSLTRSVVNGVGRVIRRIGVRWPRLDAEEFLDAAQRRTGLSDWGDNRFQQGLRNLVESFDSQDSAHTFGRFFFREFCVRGSPTDFGSRTI